MFCNLLLALFLYYTVKFFAIVKMLSNVLLACFKHYMLKYSKNCFSHLEYSEY